MSEFFEIVPGTLPVSELHSYLLGAVCPRPIGFVSTIDRNGRVNLSPFSFFNCFGANPPTLIFSPARRVRDNTIKDTLENVQEVKEAVIGIVDYQMVQQVSLASTEYDKGVNEFIKAGLTELKSDKVQPPRVKECPVSFECRVDQVIETGSEGGAGNLVVCEVLKMHIHKGVFDDKGKIDPYKLDPVARMGGNYYCRVIPESIFEVKKPIREKGMGVDQIPEEIRNSGFLTGNDLAKLANVHDMPTEPIHISGKKKDEIREQINLGGEAIRYKIVRGFLEDNDINSAWEVLKFV